MFPTERMNPAPLVGGPRDGQRYAPERMTLYPGASITSQMVRFGDHFYRLQADVSAWDYCGKHTKEGER